MLQVVTDPNPILRRPAAVAKASPEIRRLAKEMLSLLEPQKGVGLAAPQVGRSVKLFVAKSGKDPKDDDFLAETVILNPRVIVRGKEEELGLEGCLSLPGLELPIWRSSRITVEGQDVYGKPLKQSHSGFAARIVQHETDHLNGILFDERLEPLRVVFMGTPEFAVPSLRALHAHPAFKVVSVITESDKPAGRGRVLKASAVKETALALKLPVWQPKGWKDEKTVKKLAELKPDLVVVVAYGQILPQAVLDIPGFGAFNLHASLLPRWRGAAPIQAAILANDAETGITVMKMAAKLDAGDIVTSVKTPIQPDATAASLAKELAELGGRTLPSALMYAVTGVAEAKPQAEEGVTQAPKLSKEDGRIDWAQPAEEISRQVRAMFPWPGAWTEIDGTRLNILCGHIEKDKFVPDYIKPEGKAEMERSAFERGWRGTELPWKD